MVDILPVQTKMPCPYLSLSSFIKLIHSCEVVMAFLMIEFSSYTEYNPMLLLAGLPDIPPLLSIVAVTAGRENEGFILNLKSVTTTSHLLHSSCKCADVKFI